MIKASNGRNVTAQNSNIKIKTNPFIGQNLKT